VTPYLSDPDVTLWNGDALEVLRTLPDRSADACVTSPPYLNARPEYPSPTLADFADIFRELRRVVEGPLLLNVGRLWSNSQEDLWWGPLVDVARMSGWPLRDTLVWIKPNANPIHGEVLANSHEYVFILGDGYEPDAVRTEYAEESLARFTRRWRNNTGVKGEHREQDGREAHEDGARPRSFFIAYVGREKGNEHPAPMAEDLARHLILLSGGQIILDPFGGSGTTALVARKLHRRAILIELNADYCSLAADRLSQQSLFAEVAP
jgi:DNA modification methylase